MTPEISAAQIDSILKSITDNKHANPRTLVHLGPPKSKARTRFSFVSKAMYNLKETAAAENNLTNAMLRYREKSPIDGDVALVALFYRPNKQRIDGDNLMKLVLDAGTKARLWNDDCQVTAQACIIQLDRKNPRSVIAWAQFSGGLREKLAPPLCLGCKKEITDSSRKIKVRRYCSPKCYMKNFPHVQLNCVPCAFCTEVFQRKFSGQRFCSNRCNKMARSHKDRNARPKCVDCNTTIAHGFGRCKTCYLKKCAITSTKI